jgi:hypothetical protein
MNENDEKLMATFVRLDQQAEITREAMAYWQGRKDSAAWRRTSVDIWVSPYFILVGEKW